LVALFIATVAIGTPFGICIIIKEEKSFRTFYLTIEKRINEKKNKEIEIKNELGDHK
jgi:hypothetical protein